MKNLPPEYVREFIVFFCGPQKGIPNTCASIMETKTEGNEPKLLMAISLANTEAKARNDLKTLQLIVVQSIHDNQELVLDPREGNRQ